MPQKNISIDEQTKAAFEQFCRENGYTESLTFRTAFAVFSEMPHSERMRWFAKMGDDVLDVGSEPNQPPQRRGRASG